jgi:hypothetical protein
MEGTASRKSSPVGRYTRCPSRARAQGSAGGPELAQVLQVFHEVAGEQVNRVVLITNAPGPASS